MDFLENEPEYTQCFYVDAPRHFITHARLYPSPNKSFKVVSLPYKIENDSFDSEYTAWTKPKQWTNKPDCTFVYNHREAYCYIVRYLNKVQVARQRRIDKAANDIARVVKLVNEIEELVLNSSSPQNTLLLRDHYA